MFHTLTKHISRTTTEKQQKNNHTNAPTKNKEQNLGNIQNLLRQQVHHELHSPLMPIKYSLKH